MIGGGLRKGIDTGGDRDKYGAGDSKVRMYNTLPLDDIDLEYFETCSLDRLQGYIRFTLFTSNYIYYILLSTLTYV